MKKSTMFHLVAASQLLIAFTSGRAYARSGAGVDLALLLVSSVLVVICEIRALRAPRDERLPRADPRFLRRAALIFSSIGGVSLGLILYRVLALGTTLVESTNLVLTALCFVGFGYGIPAVVGLLSRPRPDSH